MLDILAKIPKGLYTVILKGLALLIGQGVVFMADIFLDDKGAVQYYSFMNSLVLFSVISSGTFPQKFAQLYQSNRNISFNHWMWVLISWNAVLLTILGIYAWLSNNIVIFCLAFSGFTLSLSAVYSENLRILGRVNASIFFPELFRSFLILLGFIFVLNLGWNIQYTITFAYVIPAVLILQITSIRREIKFKIIMPDYAILFFGVFFYFLAYDIEIIKRFYQNEDLLIFARFQKFTLLQLLVIEMWYLSESKKFKKMRMVRLDIGQSLFLYVISVALTLALAIFNLMILGSMIIDTVVYFITAVVTSFIYIYFPGKLRFQLFGFTKKYLLILLMAVLFYWVLLMFKLPILVTYIIWNGLMVLHNLIAYRRTI